MSVAARTRSRSRGQSLVEFALVLPILFTLFGATIDFARVYETNVKLESATRDAAEYAATDLTATTTALVLARAKSVICNQFGQAATCTSPSVTIVTFSSSTTAPGATTQFPLVRVKVAASFTFQTVLPYPLLTSDGSTPLGTTAEFAVLRGR
jgi:Flp pilus assembly protein TadG